MEDLPEEIDALPKNETELIAEAKRLIALLTDDPRFAGLPVSADEMRRALNKFIATRNKVAAIDVALLQAEAAVQKAFDELDDAWQRQKKANGGSAPPPILWN